MGQPRIENHTPFEIEPLFLADEEGRPQLVPVVKATFVMEGHSLALCQEQLPVNPSGEHWGAPETSSYKYEPEIAFTKPATDLVLIGHAYAPSRGATEVQVTLRVGPLQKSVRVVGDRVWVKSLGFVSMTAPLPFERIPLVYERAFGGWDRSHPDPAQHRHEPRNPVGVGFRASRRGFEEGLRLPNLEDPTDPIKRLGQVVRPAGFGFVGPGWQPRASLAGTYDDAWRKTRAPWLPEDFDRRFFNAASDGLIAPEGLRGDEEVVLLHGSPEGRMSFRLPGVRPPEVIFQRARRVDEAVSLKLDTVILNTDERCVFLLWRGNAPLEEGHREVRSIVVDSEQDLDALVDAAVPLPD